MVNVGRSLGLPHGVVGLRLIAGHLKRCNRASRDVRESDVRRARLGHLLLLLLLFRRGERIPALWLLSVLEGLHDGAGLVDAVLPALRPLFGHALLEEVKQLDEVARALEVDGVLLRDLFAGAFIFVRLREHTEDEVLHVHMQVFLLYCAHCFLHLLEVFELGDEVGLGLVGHLAGVVIAQAESLLDTVEFAVVCHDGH